ncbi:MAG TPA: DNA-formamidopyrimidine glycosylase family protein [Chitinophagaceae bacterium]|nr:DNA-formamidopyrimidine glycosylase family protein [Chitinophagaceae bacterium]
MPEGPSIVILKEAVQQFKGKKIVKVEGNSKLDIQRLSGQKIIDFKSWGKHFIICFKDFSIRIHLMMFGSYRINEEKEAVPRLKLVFAKGQLSFFACSIKFIEEDIDEVYDWASDVMNDTFNPKAARKKIKEIPDDLVCDALLNQHIFTGVGNIIKNEVLFRIHLHPETEMKNIPARKLAELIKEAQNYSFDFLEWKKAFVLKKHWLAYTKKKCPRDHVPFIKKYCGKTKRRTFYCEVCQVLYKNENKD